MRRGEVVLAVLKPCKRGWGLVQWIARSTACGWVSVGKQCMVLKLPCTGMGFQRVCTCRGLKYSSIPDIFVVHYFAFLFNFRCMLKSVLAD